MIIYNKQDQELLDDINIRRLFSFTFTVRTCRRGASSRAECFPRQCPQPGRVERFADLMHKIADWGKVVQRHIQMMRSAF